MSWIPRCKEVANRPVPYNAFVALWSLTFCLAYNRYGLVQHYGLFGLVLFGYILACVFALSWIAFLDRRSYRVAVVAFVLPTALGAYYQIRYGVPMDADSVGFLMETDFFEAREFIDADLVRWVLASMAFLSLSLWFNRRLDRASLWGDRGHAKRSAAVVLAILVATVTLQGSASFRRNHEELRARVSYKKTFPLSPLDSLKAYVKYRVRKARAPEMEDLARYESRYDDGDDKVVVLIIGESARADHFGINGYGRPTTPSLGGEANLVTFPHCISFHAFTRWSVAGMLTPSSLEHNERIDKGPFFDVFKKHGFRGALLSMNRKYSGGYLNTGRLMENAEVKVFREYQKVSNLEARDELLIPSLQSFLASPGGRKVIVLHMRGSHFDYRERYPSAFRRWTPDAAPDAPIGSPDYDTALLNAYDNSILYTDHVVGKVLDVLRDRNAAVIFSSDHGESLGEGGLYMHGRQTVEAERHVPFFVWVSDRYAQKYPQRIANLRRNATLDVSHDHIFHTMLGLGGISSRIKRDEMDLTGSQVLQAKLFWKEGARAARQKKARRVLVGARGVERAGDPNPVR